MDLAKIRKKARGQEKTAPPEVPVVQQPVVPEAAPPPDRDELSRQAPDMFFPSPPVVSELPVVAKKPRRSSVSDPVALLLAGREAAGCDEDLQAVSSELSQGPTEEYEEFLCIRVADEIYGINIMQIKEIIKPRPITEVPRAPSFVSGVISLRGVITPIIDLLARLGLSRESATGKERVVVVKNGSELCGLMVDEVTKVVRTPKNSFEAAPAVLEGIDRDFVSGIGRAENMMIILLHIEAIADIDMC